MPATSPQAVSGQIYKGVFEVHVAEPGAVYGFRVEGDGWTILSVETPAAPVEGFTGVLEIPFLAVPRDADQPIGLSLRYNGRRVRKSYRVGPRYFSQRGTSRKLVPVVTEADGQVLASGSAGADDETPITWSSSGGAIPLRFFGRFVYDRIGIDANNDGDFDDIVNGDFAPVTLGVDGIRVQVMDDDGLASDTIVDEVIWEGVTDRDGFFDSGVFMWDDCDVVGCDVPDIYVSFECDTAVAQVQTSDIDEKDYFWDTTDNILADFTDSTVNFGTLKPNDSADMPALHIWNSVVRTHRFIKVVTGINVDHVDVQWPEDDGASFYSSVFHEIHITAKSQWREGTVTHEYGHHFLHLYSDTTSPDYCNDYCDGDATCTSGTDCEDTGHCLWCPETDHDAWNEGWPNWLGSVVMRSYPIDYGIIPFSSRAGAYMLESVLPAVVMCCQDNQPYDPFITEGWVGSLLRDIEDDTQDDGDGDGIGDCLSMGPGLIFDIVINDQPLTVAQFLLYFITLYHTGMNEQKWSTAYNVHPDYAAFFPDDFLPPDPVVSLDSPSHPLGVGGSLPCITVEWVEPQDDGTAVCAYSWVWGTDPAGVEPDMNEEVFGTCITSTTFEAPDMGDYYFSVRTQDCAARWSNEWRKFGPFSVVDCNGSGFVDICDVNCCGAGCVPGPPDVCSPTDSLFCPAGSCETSEDCNVNYAPDECDIANGTSRDCNRNGIPDECEDMFHWDVESATWNFADNWLEGAVPTTDSEVCISVPGDVTITYPNDTYVIGTLACSESLDIAGGAHPWAELTLTKPSWVDGDLGLSGSLTVLTVDDSLDIYGTLNWANSGTLTGPGITRARGGMQIDSVVSLNGHTLEIGGQTVSLGRIDLAGSSTLQIEPDATYDHQSSLDVFFGSSGSTFDNFGTFIQSVDAGINQIAIFTNNHGEIRVEAGTLSLSQGSDSTGAFVGLPGTTLEFRGGGHELQPTSSIVADNVHFERGSSGSSTVRGTYNVTTTTTETSVTFAGEADVVSYGSSFFILKGGVNFDAVVVVGSIVFDTLTIGSSFAGRANFSTGQPVRVDTLSIGPGTIEGPGQVTVTGPLTWKAAAHFVGPGTIRAEGTVLVEAGGGEKTLNNRVFNNAAEMTFQGSFVMKSSAVFNNTIVGVMDIQIDGTVVATEGQHQLNNAGTIVKTLGTGTTTLHPNVLNTGTVEVREGELAFADEFIQTDGSTLLYGGNVRMSGSPDPNPLQIDGGLVSGTGLITAEVINTLGRFQPGFALGVMEIDGTYTQGLGAILEVEIGGLLQGDDYDLLAISGDAALAGRLEVVFVNGFEPTVGDAFQILTALTVTGEFDEIVVTGLPASWSIEVLYGAAAVTLNTIGPAGDLNGNGVVDTNDVLILSACLGGPNVTTPPTGCDAADFSNADLDGDGDVDMQDLALLETYLSP